MATDAQLAFADQAGSFYAREYGFPPVTGRVLGYLIVCDPPQQTINELAETLLASRSAITGAVRQLEGFHAVRRTRAAGDRLDRVSLDPAAGLQPKGFSPAPYLEQAALAREALALLADASPERRAVLEDAAGFYDFLAKRLPEVLGEWQEYQRKERQVGI
jgi:hypothetical protein